MGREAIPTEKDAGVPRTAIPALDSPYLAVFTPSSQSVLGLTKAETIIGRGNDADLELDDVRVSRHHAKIVLDATGATLVDLESANGTRIAGERISKPHALASGDVIAIGESTIVFHSGFASKKKFPESFDAKVLDVGVPIVLADPAMLQVYALLERLSSSDLPVLIQGETGTGKELAAQALHHFSPRRQKRLVTVNCAALTDTLVEAELFGHTRGAFTGATNAKPGLLEVAEGGTVLLDEVGELPPNTQAKLLRALGTKKITRVGEVEERSIDVRVVSATNRSLERDVEQGRFRADLFFRLSGAVVWLPPLAHRPRELGRLADQFLRDACRRLKRPQMTISQAALERLSSERWPGNVRELKNTMEYCAAAFSDAVLEPSHLEKRVLPEEGPREETQRAPKGFRPIEEEMRELEKTRIAEALEASGGNQRKAAALLGMPLRTFATKLVAYGLRKPR